VLVLPPLLMPVAAGAFGGNASPNCFVSTQILLCSEHFLLKHMTETKQDP